MHPHKKGPLHPQRAPKREDTACGPTYGVRGHLS